MKKLISALLIAIMLMSVAAPALAASKIYATGSVNLRSGPGLDYGKLGSISKGTSLKYLGETSTDGRGVKWYKVSYKGKTAWISSRYSSTKKGGSGGGGGGSSSGGVTATGSVNLRTGPGLDYGKLGSIKKGTSLKYLGETSTDSRGVKWYKVSYQGGTAWISSRYSSKKGGGSSSSSSSSSSSNSTPLPKPTTSAANKVTTKGTVNLRTGPSTGYKVITAVQKGSSMKYLGESSTDKNGNKWYKVSYDGREVWICGRYVTLKNNGSTVNTSSDSSSSSSTSSTSDTNPFEVTTPATPDLTNDGVPAATQSTLEAVTAAPADYVEVSGYYKTGLLETAVVLGIDGYRKVETEVPNQYFNDSLTIAGNTAVEYIGLRGTGYTVYGVCVGMTIEKAKELLTAAGLELYDGSWVTMFHHPTGTTGTDGKPVYDYSINLYTNQDGLVTELDWSTYTG